MDYNCILPHQLFTQLLGIELRHWCLLGKCVYLLNLTDPFYQVCCEVWCIIRYNLCSLFIRKIHIWSSEVRMACNYMYAISGAFGVGEGLARWPLVSQLFCLEALPTAGT